MPEGFDKVVVCIPAYNEEKTIAKILARAKKFADQVIVCDDGSNDSTGEVAEALGAAVIQHKTNQGKGEALRSLFRAAREAHADIMVTLDGDGQHDAGEIPKLVDVIKAGDTDVAIGSRFIRESANVPRGRRFGNKLLNTITLSGISDTQSGFRAYGKRAIAILNPGERGMGVDSEILIDASRLGLRIKEVPVSVRYGIGKTSKRNAEYHILDVILSVIKLASLNHPLVFYGIPGGVLLIAGMYYVLRTFDLISQTGIVTNLSITYGLIAFGLLL